MSKELQQWEYEMIPFDFVNVKSKENERTFNR